MNGDHGSPVKAASLARAGCQSMLAKRPHAGARVISSFQDEYQQNALTSLTARDTRDTTVRVERDHELPETRYFSEGKTLVLVHALAFLRLRVFRPNILPGLKTLPAGPTERALRQTIVDGQRESVLRYASMPHFTQVALQGFSNSIRPKSRRNATRDGVTQMKFQPLFIAALLFCASTASAGSVEISLMNEADFSRWDACRRL